MAIAHTGNALGLITSVGTISFSFSFTTLPTVGNHIIAFASSWANVASTTEFSDNQGNTYVTDKKQNGTTGAQAAAIGSAKVNTSAGTFTMTFASGSGAKYWKVSAVEFSGLAAASHFDQSGGTSVGTSQTSLTATAGGANSQANMLVIGCMAISSNDSAANISNPPSGYTALYVEQNANAVVGHQSSYKIVSAGETSAVTWTFDSTTGEGAAGAIATYKDATAGGSVGSLFWWNTHGQVA